MYPLKVAFEYFQHNCSMFAFIFQLQSSLPASSLASQQALHLRRCRSVSPQSAMARALVRIFPIASTPRCVARIRIMSGRSWASWTWPGTSLSQRMNSHKMSTRSGSSQCRQRAESGFESVSFHYV